MAFDLNNLNEFTNELNAKLITDIIVTGDTMQFATVQPGIKDGDMLNYLDVDVELAAAASGFNPTGTTTFDQKKIEVTAIEFKTAFDPKELEKYWIGQLMKPGTPKDLPFADAIGTLIVEKIKKQNEAMIWEGNIAGSPATMIDGYITKLLADGGYIPVAGAAAPSASDIDTKVDLMIAAMPEELYDVTPTMYMSNGLFRMYIKKMADENLYHVDANAGLAKEWTNPVTGVKFRSVAGLSGTTDMLLSYDDNLVIGTDLQNEFEKFDIWYSRDNDEMRVNVQYKLGVQTKHNKYCVLNHA